MIESLRKNSRRLIACALYYSARHVDHGAPQASASTRHRLMYHRVLPAGSDTFSSDSHRRDAGDVRTAHAVPEAPLPRVVRAGAGGSFREGRAAAFDELRRHVRRRLVRQPRATRCRSCASRQSPRSCSRPRTTSAATTASGRSGWRACCSARRRSKAPRAGSPRNTSAPGMPRRGVDRTARAHVRRRSAA